MPSIPQGSLISYMSTLVKEKGGVNLAQGLPGFEPPIQLIETLKTIASNSIHQYPPGIGNFKLLDILIENYKNYLPLNRENFLITQGATEAITLLYLYIKKLVNDDFSVMSFAPSYESYSQLPAIFGQQFTETILSESGEFDARELESAIINKNVKLMFVASPGNPLGIIIPKKSVESLIQICSKNKCFIIFDAVYKELYFEHKPYIPLEHLNPFLFYVNSFSKLLSITGWRVGYLMMHSSHYFNLKSMHDYTGLCASSILQEAIGLYLEKYEIGKSYTEDVRNKIFSAYSSLENVLSMHGFNVSKAHGGYFVWARLPHEFEDGFSTAVDFYGATGVATVPGIHFSKTANSFLRFNIARQQSDITKGLRLFKSFFQNTKVEVHLKNLLNN
jgi:aspartate/methionine/tyrosine aminotransferase